MILGVNGVGYWIFKDWWGLRGMLIELLIFCSGMRNVAAGVFWCAASQAGTPFLMTQIFRTTVGIHITPFESWTFVRVLTLIV